MNRIVIDPDICNGQSTIRGTRIAAGDAVEDVLACIGLRDWVTP